MKYNMTEDIKFASACRIGNIVLLKLITDNSEYKFAMDSKTAKLLAKLLLRVRNEIEGLSVKITDVK